VIKTGNTVSVQQTVPSAGRNRDEFITGREQTGESRTGNRAREPDYGLGKSRWAPVVISHRDVAQRKGNPLQPLRDH
jgi:nuclear transport factor 2 (NTF2) superfamily protein